MSAFKPVLAFDVYGTLIDPSGIDDRLRLHFPEKADRIIALWRQKQLEYSFRRAVMNQYVTFPVCTAQALKYACEVTGCVLTHTISQDLLAGYRQLPSFPEVSDALSRLRQHGYTLVAFSNGMPDDLQSLFNHANISGYFHSVISVDPVRDFKPSPRVYQHLLTELKRPADDCYLISGNPFDILGAISHGLHAVWIQRDKLTVFDPWGIKPTAVIRSLVDLEAVLNK